MSNFCGVPDVKKPDPQVDKETSDHCSESEKKRTLPLFSDQKFLQAILNHFQGFITVVSTDYQVLFANKALIDRTGYDPTGHICYRAFHGLKDVCPKCPMEEVLSKNTVVSAEKKSPLDERWYDTINCPFLLPSGEKAMLVVVEDIHEKKLAREKIERHREFLQTILNRIPMGIVGVRIGGEVAYVNPAFSEILGYSQEEFLGKNILDFISEEDFLKAQKRCQEVFCGVMKHNAELWWKHKNGKKRLLQSTCFKVGTPEGEEMVFNISQDITDQRRLQEQFLQSQKMEAVGRLAGGIAHDFNNILTSVKGYLHLLKLSLDQPEKVEQIISNIEKAVDKAGSLSQHLLTFSRRRPEKPRIIELRKFFEQQKEFWRRLLGENIQFALELPEEETFIEVDESHFQQILMNLVINARDAMPNGGTLSIRLKKASLEDYFLTDEKGRHYVAISVTDTGVGIDKEILPHIFDPFFTTKPVGKGTGLGLATVYSLVRQYDGHIFVKSVPGEGTTFTILWPLASPQKEKQEEVCRSVLARGNETILLVEDDPMVREPMVELLRSLGYQVLEAENGLEALKLLSHHPGVDLVISDVVMPKMGGDELAQEVRKRYPHIKILLTSGYPQTGVPVNQRLKGIDFIAKPYKLHELTEKIRKVLERPLGTQGK